jgi:hypothetical protein
MSKKLPLRLIRTDGGTQPRAELSKAVIEEYTAEMRRGDEFPPVVVFHDGDEYWLADGFHRVNARKGTAYGDITVDIRQGTKRDAILHSLGANAIHGMRRTNEDKRRAVERMLRDSEWRGWSDRQIAGHCAVSPQTVGTVRRTLEIASVQVGQIDTKRTAKRGRTTYTMNTAGLKRPAKPGTNRAVVTKTEASKPAPEQKHDPDLHVVEWILHSLRNLTQASEEIEPAVFLRKAPDNLRHNIGLSLPQSADFISKLYEEWSSTKPKVGVDSRGRDGQPVALNPFSLSLCDLFVMMNKLDKEPHEVLDYAAQHRTSFDTHEVQRAAKFLNDLAELLEARQGAATAEIRAEGARS